VVSIAKPSLSRSRAVYNLLQFKSFFPFPFSSNLFPQTTSLFFFKQFTPHQQFTKW
jgi:hypothetical protein